MTPEDLAKLEALRLLKARYFRFLDTKAWEAWGNLFTEDAVMRIDRVIPASAHVIEPQSIGRAAIVKKVSEHLAGTTTVHHGHTPELELTSATTARGIWAMEDIVERPGLSQNGHGHYHETYRLEDGTWRIATLLLTRLRLVHRSTPYDTAPTMIP